MSECFRKPTPNRILPKNRYGRLTVIGELEKRNRYRQISCKCDCGNEIITTLQSLQSGNTKSCGCYKIERIKETKITHGDSFRVGKGRNNEYTAWKAMKQRCYYKKGHNYYLYGGRGIKVCDRWLESNGQGYTNFINDMGRKPSDKHSLDRINPNKDYGPDNCRWASNLQQRKNQRTNVSNYKDRKPKNTYRTIYQKHHNVRIKRGNYVHHIDWNRENNDVDNLIEVTKGEHKWLHHSERLHFRQLKYKELKEILEDRDPCRKIGTETYDSVYNEKPILNKEYTWLTIIELIGPLNRYKTYTNVKTKCRCGSINIFPFSNIKRGLKISCGCYQKKVYNHWNKKEIDILKKHYGKMRIGLISKLHLPNRTPKSIGDKIRNLKLNEYSHCDEPIIMKNLS